MKTIVNPLNSGDVIRTHPQRGFWGCAVVLSAQDSTDDFYPCCHIATLVLIRKRKYSWKSVSPGDLKIVNLTRDVRAAPYEYIEDSTSRLSIGIYSLKKIDGLDIIANVDPLQIYSKPLSFDVGDGSNGAFPLCGPIKGFTGNDAVINWRKLNEQEKFEVEAKESKQQFEAMEQKRLLAQRNRRKPRKCIQK